MRSFIFLLTLIALVSSVKIPTPTIPNLDPDNEDEFGCVIPEGADKCCWVHPQTCCNPRKQRGCPIYRTTCCKMKNGIENGKNTYIYPKGKIIFNN